MFHRLITTPEDLLIQFFYQTARHPSSSLRMHFPLSLLNKSSLSFLSSFLLTVGYSPSPCYPSIVQSQQTAPSPLLSPLSLPVPPLPIQVQFNSSMINFLVSFLYHIPPLASHSGEQSIVYSLSLSLQNKRRHFQQLVHSVFSESFNKQ